LVYSKLNRIHLKQIVNNNYKIIEYVDSYEQSWLRCRALSFLDSAYFDDIHIKKDQYNLPSIDLIAVKDENLVGFIDIEYELVANTVCSKTTKLKKHLAGMIWHLGVHPDFRKQGIAGKLLEKAVKLSKVKGLKRLEAWTRDDQFVNDWYKHNGFEMIEQYVHWYYNAKYDDEKLLKNILQIDSNVKSIEKMFGHSKEMTSHVKQLNRKYYCRRFDKLL